MSSVAIKVFPSNLSEYRVAKCRAEAHLLQALRHPNVCSFFGTCTIRGAPALVLEYLEGGSLAGLLYGERSTWAAIPSHELLLLAKGVASGLHYLHCNNVIHRDLKADNVLLDNASPPCAKLGDFGISMLAGAAYDGEQEMGGEMAGEANVTKSLGTPRYQAPEVSSALNRASNREGVAHELLATVDTRTDVYTFGCLLYELLHGRMYMGESNTVGAMLKTWQGQRSELALRPEHGHLATMIERCWDEDPDRRMKLEDVLAQLTTALTIMLVR